MKLDVQGIISSCPNCGQRNRLGYARLDQRQRCGSCQQNLNPPAEPLDVKDTQPFAALIRLSALPVLVDFWAGWCGPCLMMAPELKKVAATMAGQVIVAKVNTEDLPDLAQLHQIASLPTLSLLWQGRELARIMGSRPAQAVVSWLQETIGQAVKAGARAGG